MDIKPMKKLGRPKGSMTKAVLAKGPNAKVKCQICGKISKSPSILTSHMRMMHTNRVKPRCDICHGVFSTPVTLRLHIKAVHSTTERPRLPCTVLGCAKTYLNKKHLLRHVQTEHAENPVQFRCTLCGKQFKRREELASHIPTHTTEKPYNCATCGRSFAHLGVMKSHEVTHVEKSTREMLQCHICLQAFLSRRGLQDHVKFVHENQRNYPCTFCDKKFSTSQHLNYHEEAVHPPNKEKIHSCDKCKYRSHSKVNLAQHVSRHNVVKRQECYFCKKKFATFQELVNHCNRVHFILAKSKRKSGTMCLKC